MASLTIDGTWCPMPERRNESSAARTDCPACEEGYICRQGEGCLLVEIFGDKQPAARSHYLGADDRPLITIRKSTAEERRAKSSPIVAGGPRCPIPKWVVVWVEPRPGMLPFVCTFGMPNGGATRAEAVFWAERSESKNDLCFVRPEGWENIEGRLPADA